ncbi:MAG: hypothetical protein AAFY59_19820 [Pseudomonadota bacterium]
MRPSGKQVFQTRDVAPNNGETEPEGPSGAEEPTGEEAPEEEERVADFAQSEIEDLLGFAVPGFNMASLVSEDEDGNRTIEILQTHSSGTISRVIDCGPDDTCKFGEGKADPDYFSLAMFK